MDGETVGVEITLAAVGSPSGTSTTEIFRWLFALHFAPGAPSGYDCTYRRSLPCFVSGTSVCVCEPQSVTTVVICCGLAGSAMETIRIPSQWVPCVNCAWLAGAESQASDASVWSTETNTRSFQIETSDCVPTQVN